jgi:hypothetical protein
LSLSWHRLAIVWLLLVLIASCSTSPPPPPSPAPEATIEALSQQIAALSAQISRLQIESVAAQEPPAPPTLAPQSLPPDVEAASLTTLAVSESHASSQREESPAIEEAGTELFPDDEPPIEASQAAVATPQPTPSQPPTPFPTRTVRPTSVADSAPCRVGQVKGNKSSRIYHVPGGASYPRTANNVECFDSEDQALAAGYRKARN